VTTSSPFKPSSYDSPGKARYHEDIASFLYHSREHGARLWNDDKTIRFFDGERGIVEDGGIIFVDDDAANIARFRDEFPRFSWIHGNLFDLLHDDRLEEAGILLVDGFSEVGDRRIASQLPNIHGLIRKSIAKRGSFALAINCVLDTVVRRKRTRASALREWSRVLAKGLSGYLPRRTLDPESLLPAELAGKVDEDGQFVGPLGSFFISKSHVQRMANFRVLLV
jgi:hypothetical protein